MLPSSLESQDSYCSCGEVTVPVEAGASFLPLAARDGVRRLALFVVPVVVLAGAGPFPLWRDRTLEEAAGAFALATSDPPGSATAGWVMRGGGTDITAEANDTGRAEAWP